MDNEKNEQKNTQDNKIKLPLVALRDIVAFPHSYLSFDVGRAPSVEALQEAVNNDSLIFLTAQKNAGTDDPSADDLHRLGTITRIRQILRLPGSSVRVIAEGVERGVIEDFIQDKPYFKVNVNNEGLDGVCERSAESEALVRLAHADFEEYAMLNGKFFKEAVTDVIENDNPGVLADMIASNMQIKPESKQLLLEEPDQLKRLTDVIALLHFEIEMLKLQNSIASKVKKNVDDHQREYFLREQLKVIRGELGDKAGDLANELDEYRKRLQARVYPKKVREKAEKELARLERGGGAASDASMTRDYLDWLLDLEWSAKTDEDTSLAKAREILERDHYGLEKVKERVVEFLAVRLFAPRAKDAPILCLVGPPGVGKTSVAKSVAECLNRRYVRISLGGVRDEAEIRGHRRTYVGSLPGRIIYAIKQAGTANPLILLDEIDKLSQDFRGNPADALLEALDGEQNVAFRDHYMEVPYDLSDVMFICTANSTDRIPQALKDRMDIIAISGYTPDEKIKITEKYLVPKQMKKHGLKKSQLKLKAGIYKEIIMNYTREAGVRQAERCISELCRKAVRRLLTDEQKSVTVTAGNLEDFLGKPKYRRPDKNETDEAGVARGLAWTAVGGETLSVEVNTMRGTGKFELTGSMGDVMKESARAAVSYIRSRSDVYKIDKLFYKNTDIHLHIPEGAVPKDGPSAGITMAVAILSALTGAPVRSDVGMTGEITVRGRVLPIGGLKEKVIAAKDAGLKRIILPQGNENDLNELPEYIRDGLEFVLAKDMDTVVKNALAAGEAYGG